MPEGGCGSIALWNSASEGQAQPYEYRRFWGTWQGERGKQDKCKCVLTPDGRCFARYWFKGLRDCWEEEGEDLVEAGGPGVFVVDCTGDLEKFEVDTGLPALFEEHAVQ